MSDSLIVPMQRPISHIGAKLRTGHSMRRLHWHLVRSPRSSHGKRLNPTSTYRHSRCSTRVYVIWPCVQRSGTNCMTPSCHKYSLRGRVGVRSMFPADLVERIESRGIVIADWKDLHDKLKARHDKLAADLANGVELCNQLIEERDTLRVELANLRATAWEGFDEDSRSIHRSLMWHCRHGEPSPGVAAVLRTKQPKSS